MPIEKCKKCWKNVEVIYYPNFYKIGENWRFHISARCPECNRFIKNLEQTDELMESVKNQIESNQGILL